MKNMFVKKVHLFFTSIFIFVLHIPYVFSKAKPLNAVVLNPLILKQHLINTNAADLSLVKSTTNKSIYDSLLLGTLGLNQQVFDYAMQGFNKMKQLGSLENEQVISIVDLSKSSNNKRLYVIDLKNCKMLFNTYVAHGVNSGKEFAKQFSNVMESNQSSLGFYTTTDTYFGKHGYSLHLRGMEKGINDNAFKRDIVVHGANYVSKQIAQAKGFVGRSHGCPAIPEYLKKAIIDKIKNGTCLFIFGEDKSYVHRSNLINYNLSYNLAHI